MKSDTDIIQLFQNGDETAMKLIFDNYYEGLCIYAESILRDHYAAEEIVEQLFIHLWVNVKTLTFNTSVKNYMYRSIHNNCLKYIDKRKNELKSFDKYIFHDPEILRPVTDDYPLSILIVQELEQKAEEVMESLPDQCRKIYFLSRYENLSYPEIASKLKITVGTVKTQMSRAFQRFREELKDYLPFIIFFLLSK